MFENIVSLPVGIEPTTSRLTAERSTTELRKQWELSSTTELLLQPGTKNP